MIWFTRITWGVLVAMLFALALVGMVRLREYTDSIGFRDAAPYDWHIPSREERAAAKHAVQGGDVGGAQ